VSRRARLSLVGALAATAVTAALLTSPSTAAQGSAAPDEFRPQLVTVDTPDRAAKQRLQALGLDLTEHAGHDFVEVVLHTASELDALTGSGLTYDVRIADLVARGVEIAEINEAYAASVASSPLPSGRDTYRTLDDYNADMTRLAAEHKKLVKKFALKRPSLDGRTIYGIEIGKNVRKPNAGQPTFVMLGLHHAREWPSGEMAMEFAFDLVDSYGKSKRITKVLEKARVVVVPVVNVDGFVLSRTDGEYSDLRELNDEDPTGGTVVLAATPGQTYKRKNCRVVDGQDTPDGSCQATAASPGGFALGVDLNRNYGGFWGGPGAAETEPDANDVEAGIADPTYGGASAFSEPETQNVHDLIASRQVTMMISNHTFSNLVLRPNGVNPTTIGHDGKPVGDAPDEAALKKLGAKMAAQNGYANIHGWQLYDTTGTTEDWSYNATGGFGYTFEVGANEFHPPFPEVVDQYFGTGEYAGTGNRGAYLVALEHTIDKRYSGVLKGKAPKGATLRLKKVFSTPTWSGSFKDGVESTMTVGKGRFSWIVNPSTRPVVRSHPYEELATSPFATKTIEGGPIEPDSYRDHPFVLEQDTSVWHIELDWPTPDDLDLEIYRKGPDGQLTEVGSSGNTPGQKEATDITDAEAGDYVLRVINFASATPTYTLTNELFASVTKHTQGKREKYVLTCEKNGKVLQTSEVFIDRGKVKKLDLAKCRRKW
jgi:hypothetical protein